MFEMEEEKIPIYKPPQPEGSDAEDEADGIADGAEPEDGGDAWRPSACRNATPLRQTQSVYRGCILLPDLLSLGRRLAVEEQGSRKETTAAESVKQEIKVRRTAAGRAE